MPTAIPTAGTSEEVTQSGSHLLFKFGVIIGEMPTEDCSFVSCNNLNFILIQRIPFDHFIPFFFSFQEFFSGCPLSFVEFLPKQTRLLLFR